MSYTTINKSTEHFNTKLYTGNGSARSITGVGFQPDWVWVKDRSDAQNHGLREAVRGATKRLVSNDTAAENTQTQGLSSFDSDGFSLGTGVDVNANSDNYVSWNWKANGAGSANTDGSINSTVSANTTAGFSIVSYTGTGANATVGHGLGVAPKLLILKSRTRSDGQWTVGSDMLGWSKFLYLDANSAEQTFNLYQNTAPTSSVFYLSGDGGVNQSGGNMIGYAFAEKTGYSKFGTYTGNGNADGTFIYTGFKPAFVMNKKTDGTMDWHIWDNKRNSFNVIDKLVYPNLSNGEDTLTSLDFVSNGFKIRDNRNFLNASGSPYIYMAFAEAPLVGQNNVPCTAR